MMKFLKSFLNLINGIWIILLTNIIQKDMINSNQNIKAIYVTKISIFKFPKKMKILKNLLK